MRKLAALLFCLNTVTYAQSDHWVNKPKDQWPQIALINEVWYSTGERYIHPSFEYAATGFLIDTGKDTLAATAKHVLWIAKTKTMNAVDLHGKLDRWVMHPKGNLKDSVVVEELVNKDSNELLNGSSSSITQRDWIVFTTSYTSPNIQPLKPRYAEVKPGEKVYYTGCPYNEEECVTNEGAILEVEGNRIVFSIAEGTNVAGASGSPIIDEKGMLVGILGGAATAKSTGEDALYGTSTHYLKKILTNEQPLNVPLVSISEKLEQIYADKGLTATLEEFEQLKKDRGSFFIYDFSPEQINVFGRSLLEINQPSDAIEIFKLSIRQLPLSSTYTELGKAYLKQEKKKYAKSSFEKALELWPKNEVALTELNKLK